MLLVWCVLYPKHSKKIFQQSAEFYFFHSCQVHSWCHHLVHIVFWLCTKVFYIDENCYACEGGEE